MNQNKDDVLNEIKKASQIIENLNKSITVLNINKENMTEEEYEEQIRLMNDELEKQRKIIDDNKKKLNEINNQTSTSKDESYEKLEADIYDAKQQFKKQKDYSEDGKFVSRSINVVNNSLLTINKLSNMASLYDEIPTKWAFKKSEIIREKARITDMSMEERKKKMDEICDFLDAEIEAIENNPSLSDEEKETEKQKKYAELSEKVYLIEEYPNLSQKEKDEKLDEELEIIDKAIYEDQKLAKKKMAHVMTMQILLLGRYLKKGYDSKEIYEALKILAEIKLDNKELEKYLKTTFDETLLRNPELQRIYIAYSEKQAYEEEKNEQLSPVKDGVDVIEELLDEAESKLDRNLLDKACKLIADLPNGDNKNDFQARAAQIDKLIKNQNENDGPVNDADLTSEDDPKPELPVINENSPKKTWKTYVALAAGIGVGATVFFTCGTVGVSVMAIAGGIAKMLISKRRKKLQMQRLNGELPVESVEEPMPGIKGKIQKLKEYFKSEEFCRDANWFLNGAIYTGLGLNIASSIYNFAAAKLAATPDTIPTPDSVITDGQPKLDPATTTTSDPMSGIKIGDNVGDYNVSVGHDTANWATTGSNTENLISEYVNEGSIFKRFAVMNPDGTVARMINTNGLSITDFCNQSGIDPSQIAVDVASKNGTSQAWVSVSELLKGVGGKGL